jgi:hypothetical protein
MSDRLYSSVWTSNMALIAYLLKRKHRIVEVGMRYDGTAECALSVRLAGDGAEDDFQAYLSEHNHPIPPLSGAFKEVQKAIALSRAGKGGNL